MLRIAASGSVGVWAVSDRDKIRVRSSAADGCELRPIDANANQLAIPHGFGGDITDDRAAFARDAVGINRTVAVEDEPYLIGAAKHRNGGRRIECKNDAQTIAGAFGLGRDFWS